jgi:hypothetical protein
LLRRRRDYLKGDG